MQMKIVVVLLLASVCAVSAIVCPKNICQTVRCVNVEQEDCEQNQNGVYEEKGGFCGCCAACLTKLTEGQSCKATRLGLGDPPKAKCAPGLVCESKTLTCVDPTQ